MAKIRISAPAVKPRNLVVQGDGGASETFKVNVRPPGFPEEQTRGRLLSRISRSYNEHGYPVTSLEVNLPELYATEIWLTFAGSDLDVEVETGEGEYERVTFEVGLGWADFMDQLGKLPPGLIRQWRAMVVDVVRAWADPFAL